MFEELSALPIKQKVGQLFFIGIPDTEIDADTKDFLKDISPGGICLFSRNIHEAAQVRRLLETIREILPVEPLLSLDQEGGLVDRLRRIVAPMPPPSSLKTPADAKALAEITAEIMGTLGFNMNFAPVVDVIDAAREKTYNGLYSRAFGRTKSEVAEFTEQYLENLQSRGVLGCLKHFPGIGASTVDSHEELPIVYLTREELFEIDLLPYRRLLEKEIVHSIMIAHASYPRFDLQETDENGKLLPSSLSFNIITKLLREEMNFQGLTITDDLEMGAIVKNYGIGEASQMAISAGVDMLAICANPVSIREGFNAVLKAIESGKITESRIDESLKRIGNLKSRMKKPFPFDAERLQALSNEITRLNTNGG